MQILLHNLRNEIKRNLFNLIFRFIQNDSIGSALKTTFHHHINQTNKTS